MSDAPGESAFDRPAAAQSAVGLLDPRRAALPAHGRAEELAELVEWCEQPDDEIVGLLAAAPGCGATRLGVELAAAMRARGWVAGMLRGDADPQALAALAAGPGPVLVVVDDAEVRGEDVAALKPVFLMGRHGPRPRILLIGHADDSMGLETALRPAFEQLGYPYFTIFQRLAGTDLAVEERLRVWRDAVAALAPRLPDVAAVGCVPWAVPPLGVPAIDPPAGLLDRAGGVTVPEVQFAALAALLEAPDGDAAADQVVAWESWYWFQQAIEHQLFFPDPGAYVPLAAQAAIWGAGTREEAVRLVTAMLAPAGPEPAVAEQIAGWLSGLYPGPGRFWRFPHALAAHLAATDAVAEDGLLRAASASAGQTRLRHAAELLLPVLPGSPRVCSAVVEAAQAASELWSPAIVHTALACGPRPADTPWRRPSPARQQAAVPPPAWRVDDGIIALVEALDRASGDALNLLSDLEQALPSSDGPLGKVALAVARKLAGALAWINGHQHGQMDVHVAVCTGRLALRLSDLGRPAEAAQTARQAADLLRPHAAGDGDLTDYLAWILRLQAIELAAVGRPEQAAAAASESAGLYRELVAVRPGDELRLGLAIALISYAEALRDMGRGADGQPAAREALALIEPLARQDRHIAGTWLPRVLDLQPPG